MVIAPMRPEKLRQVDLDLLIIFAVIAEERSATKASARLLLSQPAVSRALQRARSMFQDELVIRSSSGFELTLRGRKILQELEQLLPKIEGLVVPSVFDPKKVIWPFRAAPPEDRKSARCFIVSARDGCDKPLKFWLQNSCTNTPEQRLFVQQWGISPEPNRLIPNTRL